MDNEDVSEATKLKIERRKQYEQELNEYNNKCKLVPITELKKWAGSWIVLVLSILVTVTAVLTLIGLFTNLNGGWIKIVKNLVSLLLSILACVGFWRSYVMGRSKNNDVNLGGPKMLRGVLTFNKVIMYLIMIAIIGLAILIIATLMSCAKDVDTSVGNVGGDISGITTAFNGILIGILVALIAVFVVLIIYYTTISHFADNVIDSLQNKRITLTKCTSAAVFFFIIGAFTLILALAPFIGATVINNVFEQLNTSSEIFGKLNLSVGVDVPELLENLVKGATYVFAGILALRFSGIDQTINRARLAIKKPEAPEA